MVRPASLTWIILLASLAGACGDSGAPTPPDAVGPPADLRIVSGNEQRAIAGQVLPQPVVVQVVDSSERPVPGQPVAFEVDRGGGAVSLDTGYTDASGTVEQQWTLGPGPGEPQRLFIEVVYIGPRGPAIYTFAHATAMAAPAGLHFREVEAGGIHSCGLTPEGKAYCWGTRDDGVTHLAPTAVAGDLTFASIAAGVTHTCALTLAGAAYCWGQNQEGQLGFGNRGRALDPGAVSSELVFQEIAVGYEHTCALTLDGDSYCWGGNQGFGGQLGDGTTTDRLRPTRVLGGHTFRALALGGGFSCALNAEGQAYCWGHRIGTRTGASDLAPVAVPGRLAFASVSAGSSHVCGLIFDGTAYCWGDNFNGQLGNGTLTESRTPVAVSGGLTFSAIDAGAYHTCGITTSGSLVCWGWDDQFVDSREFNGGTSIHSTTPTPVPGAPTFVQLSGGLSHGCGVTAEQLAYCWFDNSAGQLGTGDQTSSYQPVLVR